MFRLVNTYVDIVCNQKKKKKTKKQKCFNMENFYLIKIPWLVI